MKSVLITIYTLLLIVSAVVGLVVTKDDGKRIILHADDDIHQTIQTMQAELAALKHTIGLMSTDNNRDLGVTYIRWGHTSCPGNGSSLLYSGTMAGPRYSHAAGGTNNLCLPDHPSWSNYVDGFQANALIWGTEMENGNPSWETKLFSRPVHDEDVPCSLCESARSQIVMLPGHTTCYPGWTLEYSGYIVGPDGDSDGASGVGFECLDSKLEFIARGEGDDNGNLIVAAEVHCGTIPCPPYEDGRELACVVCTK